VPQNLRRVSALFQVTVMRVQRVFTEFELQMSGNYGRPQSRIATWVVRARTVTAPQNWSSPFLYRSGCSEFDSLAARGLISSPNCWLGALSRT
jgi:hypothetical protein